MLLGEAMILAKICSTMRGMIPLVFSSSMSAPFLQRIISGSLHREKRTCSLPIHYMFLSYHHCERFTGTSLTVSEYSSVVTSSDVCATPGGYKAQLPSPVQSKQYVPSTMLLIE